MFPSLPSPLLLFHPLLLLLFFFKFLQWHIFHLFYNRKVNPPQNKEFNNCRKTISQELQTRTIYNQISKCHFYSYTYFLYSVYWFQQIRENVILSLLGVLAYSTKLNPFFFISMYICMSVVYTIITSSLWWC